MIKKALVALIAAGALSVPLAGVAWADPPSQPNDPPGRGGVPKEAGDYLGAPKVTPGQEFNLAKQTFPGVNTPEAVRQFVNLFYAGTTNGFTDPIPPGIATKTFTPACGSGRTGTRWRRRRPRAHLPLKGAVRVPPASRSSGAGGATFRSLAAPLLCHFVVLAVAWTLSDLACVSRSSSSLRSTMAGVTGGRRPGHGRHTSARRATRWSAVCATASPCWWSTASRGRARWRASRTREARRAVGRARSRPGRCGQRVPSRVGSTGARRRDEAVPAAIGAVTLGGGGPRSG